MNPQLQAQANQSAAQGQADYSRYNSQAGAATNSYNDYQHQSDVANQAVQKQTQYMQGEGSAGNQYHNELGSQMGKVGYNQDQMTAATNNLNQSTGAMSAYNDFANTAASKWGLNAGGFAAANAGAMQGINNNIASNQGVVNGLLDKYKTAQTGANQFAGNQVQQQQVTMSGLQDSYANASNQRDSAAAMIKHYTDLAQAQGTLNAQQQQVYSAAQQQYAAAQQGLAMIGQIHAQTQGINLANTRTQNDLDFQGAQAQQGAQAHSDAMYQAMQQHAPSADPNVGMSGLFNHLGNAAQNTANWLRR